jgi:hypothetical protein
VVAAAAQVAGESLKASFSSSFSSLYYVAALQSKANAPHS